MTYAHHPHALPPDLNEQAVNEVGLERLNRYISLSKLDPALLQQDPLDKIDQFTTIAKATLNHRQYNLFHLYFIEGKERGEIEKRLHYSAVTVNGLPSIIAKNIIATIQNPAVKKSRINNNVRTEQESFYYNPLIMNSIKEGADLKEISKKIKSEKLNTQRKLNSIFDHFFKNGTDIRCDNHLEHIHQALNSPLDQAYIQRVSFGGLQYMFNYSSPEELYESIYKNNAIQLPLLGSRNINSKRAANAVDNYMSTIKRGDLSTEERLALPYQFGRQAALFSTDEQHPNLLEILPHIHRGICAEGIHDTAKLLTRLCTDAPEYAEKLEPLLIAHSDTGQEIAYYLNVENSEMIVDLKNLKLLPYKAYL